MCLVPMTPCETLLYWSHISALVAYNGGTSVGHGRVGTHFLEPDFVSRVGTPDVSHGLVRTLFRQPDFVSSVGTLDVWHGPFKTLFLTLVLSLVPMTPYEAMLCWPPNSALVAYNGGTSVSHGPVRTLFLEPVFASCVGTLDFGYGPVRTLFMSLVLCLVPITPCETMLYWPHISALLSYNGGTGIGNGPVRTFFLVPDLVSRVGTLDGGHGPVRTLLLSLVLCLVPMTPCETMLYWAHISALVAYNGGTSIGHGPMRTLFLSLVLPHDTL